MSHANGAIPQDPRLARRLFETLQLIEDAIGVVPTSREGCSLSFEENHSCWEFRTTLASNEPVWLIISCYFEMGVGLEIASPQISLATPWIVFWDSRSDWTRPHGGDVVRRLVHADNLVKLRNIAFSFASNSF